MLEVHIYMYYVMIKNVIVSFMTNFFLSNLSLSDYKKYIVLYIEYLYNFLYIVYVYTRARTHARMHARMHARTHARTHAHI